MKNGAPGGIRTPDPLIRSEMLYPLSHGRNMTRLPETQQVTRIGEPRCVRCRCRHRPDLPCWKGRYAAETTAAVLAQSAVCWICRGPATEADHIQPRSEGGDDALANLRPACRSCNAGRRLALSLIHI